ncbi:hypothetical protein CBR_g29899 [Chara braunii]|uniref:Myb-like domain-containing protein n=1 Tax=Chara braunii TaxID=69332 RepID=A0A388JWV7_CHABU|nr:hypothetical protein CBR_g29899 [Chara braunii]|eukprot:GBG62291.1 hypothetical protein CBR_g29899 [Chara braunii]
MEPAFQSANSLQKGHLWEEVGRKMSDLGYQRSAKKCKEKWENVTKYYRKTKESSKSGGADARNYRYYAELERFYREGGESALAAAAAARSSQGGDGNGGASEESEEEEHEGLGGQEVEEEEDELVESGGKRKRKRRGDVEEALLSMERMMKRILYCHHQQQQRMFETIDKREKDRLAKEEEWRRQEQARLAHEQKLRESEHVSAANRESALVIILQKLAAGMAPGCPQPLSLPLLAASLSSPTKPSVNACALPTPALGAEAFPPQQAHGVAGMTMAMGGGTPATVFAPAGTAIARGSAATPASTLLAGGGAKGSGPVATVGSEGGADAGAESPATAAIPVAKRTPSVTPVLAHDPEIVQDRQAEKRWPKQQVQALIQFRSSMEGSFQEPGPKQHLWEVISARMARLGFSRSAKRCKEKWENINKYFRRSKSKGRVDGKKKKCPYFALLDELYNDKGRGGMLLAACSAGEEGTDLQAVSDGLEPEVGQGRTEGITSGGRQAAGGGDGEAALTGEASDSGGMCVEMVSGGGGSTGGGGGFCSSEEGLRGELSACLLDAVEGRVKEQEMAMATANAAMGLGAEGVESQRRTFSKAWHVVLHDHQTTGGEHRGEGHCARDSWGGAVPASEGVGQVGVAADKGMREEERGGNNASTADEGSGEDAEGGGLRVSGMIVQGEAQCDREMGGTGVGLVDEENQAVVVKKKKKKKQKGALVGPGVGKVLGNKFVTAGGGGGGAGAAAAAVGMVSKSTRIQQLEGMVKGLVNSQQEQQKQLMEYLSRSEQERLKRDEERRQQEEARLAREQARAAERESALMALVQKLTCNPAELPTQGTAGALPSLSTPSENGGT